MECVNGFEEKETLFVSLEIEAIRWKEKEMFGGLDGQTVNKNRKQYIKRGIFIRNANWKSITSKKNPIER